MLEFESFGLAALTCGPSGVTRTASCSAVGVVETLVLCHSNFLEELVKVEAKSRTANMASIEVSDGDDHDNVSTGTAKKPRQDRRHSSVRDVLACLAEDQMDELRKQDEG